jgi:hypothetical protein
MLFQLLIRSGIITLLSLKLNYLIYSIYQLVNYVLLLANQLELGPLLLVQILCLHDVT